MPTTQAQVDIINQALSLLGVNPVTSIDDGLASDDPAVVQASIHWLPSLDTLGRLHRWQCITKPQVLAQVAQDPIDPTGVLPPPAAWIPGGHAYLAGDYVGFGNPQYIYQALVANVSTASFTNDLTSGFWMQTDQFNPNPFGNAGCGGCNYASGFAYKYNLPADCLLVTEYNGCTEFEELFEIMGGALYSNDAQAVIKFTWADPDTTRYDALFVECLTFKLAAKMATKLRQDDTNVAQQMEGLFLKKLGVARAKDSGERRPRRFNPVANSRWVGARYRSTNS